MKQSIFALLPALLLSVCSFAIIVEVLHLKGQEKYAAIAASPSKSPFQKVAAVEQATVDKVAAVEKRAALEVLARYVLERNH